MEAWKVVKERTRRWSSSVSGYPPSPTLGLQMKLLEEDSSKPIALNLGNLKLKYTNKMWLQDSGTNPELIERNRTLEAENHLLRFKLNALLDMLTSSKLDTVRLQGELEAKR